MLAGHTMLDGCRATGGELVSARASGVVYHGNAAGLASCNVAALEDDDLEAALDQLLGSAHARHATAKDDDLTGHPQVLLSLRRSAAARAAGPAAGGTSATIASDSFIRSAIFSYTRKTNIGSGATCKKLSDTSVAITSSTGAPPSATTTPLLSGSVDERSNGPPPRNGMMRSCGNTSDLSLGVCAARNNSWPSATANGPK